jgi:hypothetical protein
MFTDVGELTSPLTFTSIGSNKKPSPIAFRTASFRAHILKKKLFFVLSQEKCLYRFISAWQKTVSTTSLGCLDSIFSTTTLMQCWQDTPQITNFPECEILKSIPFSQKGQPFSSINIFYFIGLDLVAMCNCNTSKPPTDNESFAVVGFHETS